MTNKECPFCDSSQYEKTHGLAACRLDRYPVSVGHRLIIPIRHVEKFSDITSAEMKDILDLARLQIAIIEPSADGFNVGWNLGYAAGQIVPHVHLHIIPRISGDVPDPKGGIRGVIPEKKVY